MDHYREAERLLGAGHITVAIGHALLAIVDEFRLADDAAYDNLQTTKGML